MTQYNINYDRICYIPGKAYGRLKHLTIWYNNMPDEDFGDAFTNRVESILNDLLPPIPDVEHFYYCTPVWDNDLFVELNDVHGDLIEVIKISPE